jgi:hypothetical protein
MQSKELKCPKCDGTMLQGFVPDATYGAVLVSQWYQERPKKGFFGWSTKAPRSRGVPIGAFRCESCGYLEFYADAEFAAE